MGNTWWRTVILPTLMQQLTTLGDLLTLYMIFYFTAMMDQFDVFLESIMSKPRYIPKSQRRSDIPARPSTWINSQVLDMCICRNQQMQTKPSKERKHSKQRHNNMELQSATTMPTTEYFDHTNGLKNAEETNRD